MIAEYEIAKLNIRVITDFDMSQNGPSRLFASSFEKSDAEIGIALGCINADDTPVYTDGFVDVYRDKNNVCTAVYYRTDNGKKINHFSVCGSNCVLTRDSNAESRDMFHFWGMIGLPHILIQHRRVMLHCSYVISNGRAILFCGKSGIGKSTQAQLWKENEGAKIVNGDKAVIFEEDGRLFASSLPICGTSKICENETAQVGAIVFLSQSDENRAEQAGASENVSLLASNSIFDLWRDGEMLNVVELCAEFAPLTKIIKYGCLPDKSAVDELKKVIE